MSIIKVSNDPIDDDGNTRLHRAAATGKLQEILDELTLGEKIDRENYLGWTPLMMAARRGQLKAVQILLSSQADATKHNRFGTSTFLIAIAGGNLQIIGLILQHLLQGGVSRLIMENILSPLSMAALFRKQDVLEYLLTKQSFNINCPTPRTHITPVMFATAINNTKALKLLISKNADLNVRNANGQNANDLLYKRRQLEQQASGQQDVVQQLPPVILVSPQPIFNLAPLAPYPKKSSNVGTPHYVLSPHLTPITVGQPSIFFPPDFSLHHLPVPVNHVPCAPVNFNRFVPSMQSENLVSPGLNCRIQGDVTFLNYSG